MWYSNGWEIKLDWSSGNNWHWHSSIILHQRGVRNNLASRAWHFHTPETIVIHVCTLLSHNSSMKRDSIYLHWQRLVDLTFTSPYWNKSSCQKPVFLEQGWCNSSISLCLAANWMFFELTLNRIVTLINSKKISVPRTDWQILCGTIHRKKYRFCINSKVLLESLHSIHQYCADGWDGWLYLCTVINLVYFVICVVVGFPTRASKMRKTVLPSLEAAILSMIKDFHYERQFKKGVVRLPLGNSLFILQIITGKNLYFTKIFFNINQINIIQIIVCVEHFCLYIKGWKLLEL
jgi:hypothetical protein